MPYLHLRKPSLKSSVLLLFIVGVIGFQARVSAEDIILKNGKVLESATVVGETDRTLIIQYDDGVKSFPLHLLPDRYHPVTTQDTVVAAPADGVSGAGTAPESQAATVSDEEPGGGDDTVKRFEHFVSEDESNDFSGSSNSFDEAAQESEYNFDRNISNFLRYYQESNRASAKAFVAMMSEVPKKGLWVAGFASVAILSVASLIVAIFFRIVVAVTRLPLSTYGKCYRVVWLASILAFVVGVLSAIYVPGFVLWPWYGLLISLVIGCVCAMVIYGQSPIHGIMSYFVFWLIFTSIDFGLIYMSYSSGVPVGNGQQINEAADFLKERFGEVESEESSD